jgi:hypothetical protein
MKKIVILFFTLTIIISCKKYSEIKSDVNDNLYIYGRLHLQDSINDIGSVKPLLKEVTVNLSYKKEPSKIIYTTKANTEGYFSFLNLTKGEEYIVAAETENGTGDFKALFSTKTNVLLNTTQNSLAPILTLDNEKQNGVLFTIKDDLTRGLIGGCNICFFSSRQLWQTDTCVNSLFNTASNTNGVSFKSNVLPGKYYLLFKKQIGSVWLQAKDSVNIIEKGVVNKEIILK